MHLYLKRDGQWVEIAEEYLKAGLELFAHEIKLLRFMMAFDTGWTGIIFQAEGKTFALCENWDHVVDVRKI